MIFRWHFESISIFGRTNLKLSNAEKGPVTSMLKSTHSYIVLLPLFTQNLLQEILTPFILNYLLMNSGLSYINFKWPFNAFKLLILCPAQCIALFCKIWNWSGLKKIRTSFLFVKFKRSVLHCYTWSILKLHITWKLFLHYVSYDKYIHILRFTFRKRSKYIRTNNFSSIVRYYRASH